jgi:NADH-quinone oxidoreductase subunit M
VLFDKVARPEFDRLADLAWRDYALLGPLAVVVIWLGIYPASFTHVFDSSVAAMVRTHVAQLSPTSLAPTSLAMVAK